jgi:alpha-glucosidase/alpha-D-xyloside xylohydrolase
MALMVNRGKILISVVLAAFAGPALHAQNSGMILERDGNTIVLEPYAPNIVRVTLSKNKAAATEGAGYGFVGKPSATGWTLVQDSDGSDVFRSARLVVRVSPDHLAKPLLPQHMPLDDLNQSLRDHYFGAEPSRGRPNQDAISVTTASGQMLLNMLSWFMIPNHPEIAAADASKQEQKDPGFRVSATFDSPADEHYYGLGQQQQGVLDLRDRQVRCWHDYSAIGGESVCVPFMVSSRGYGLIWDNPSKTTINLGFNQPNMSETGFPSLSSQERTATKFTRVTVSLPASLICCRKRRMATSRARRSILPRISYWPLQRGIAIVSSHWMFLWSTSLI